MNAGKNFIPCLVCSERVPFKDHIEECLGSDLLAQQVLDSDARAVRELSNQSLEHILEGMSAPSSAKPATGPI